MGTLANSGNISVKIEGGVSGQVAIGNNILQIGDMRGGIVNFIQPDKKPTFNPRTQPVIVRPRPFPGFLNRETEMSTAVDALRIGTSVSVYGENGLGKTSFLRHLSYNSPMDNFPHGVVYFPAHGQMVEDLLQVIFDHFYQSDSTAKPTDAELHQFLQKIQALILLDDVLLNYDEITELINAVPQCVFVLASPDRCLWGEGRCIKLQGLPLQSALSLFERELSRTLTPKEQSEADTLCQIATGQPLLLIQYAAQVRAGKPIEGILRTFQASEEGLDNAILSKLTIFQRAILGILTVLKNAPVPLKHLSALTQADDFDAQLKTLLDLRLVQTHSPTVSLAGSMALTLGQLSAADWEARSLNYFVRWIKQNPPLPDVTDVLDLILSLLEKANRDGRWNDVISLGRGIEKVLVLNKRWRSWWQVLQWILKAAQSLGDQGTQAWALHQLGTRSLCLGDIPSARQSLTQALGIRESLGDKAGAAVTRHNLGLIGAPPVHPHEAPRSTPKLAPAKGTPLALKAILGLMIVSAVAVILLLLWLFWNQPPSPVPPVNITATKHLAPPVVVATKTPVKKPTSTFVPTRTRQPTVTIQPCAPGIWYCENFNDNKAQGWDTEPEWSIQRDGSNYVLGGTGHKWASLTDHDWDDFRLTFRLRLFSGGIHVCYRVSGGFRYFIGITEHGLYVSRQVNDQFTDFRSINWSPSIGDWHNVEISGWSGHLRVYVDGALKLEIVDQDFIRSGSIAFETLDNSSAQIDDIEVTGSGQEPPVESYAPPSEPQVYPTETSFVDIPTITPELPVIIIIPATLPVACTSYYMTWEQGYDRPGMDYWNGEYISGIDPIYISPEKCQDMCLNNFNGTTCMAFTYDTNTHVCWLKSGQPDAVYKEEDVSGIKQCQ